MAVDPTLLSLSQTGVGCRSRGHITTADGDGDRACNRCLKQWLGPAAVSNSGGGTLLTKFAGRYLFLKNTKNAKKKLRTSIPFFSLLLFEDFAFFVFEFLSVQFSPRFNETTKRQL
jgi:hypothetical protein